ncbi:uncharacterized protein LOC133795972 [Humulus lupulus]|uniref:uncharacterized protein LOC133795972 n=1 Tax=Humulus lupulus TaxID=3486 RepID=UPI002B40CA13|nr:uncharacterized protein LOC133795972 [Humulus lupulus]
MPLQKEIINVDIELVTGGLAKLLLQSSLLEQIREGQKVDDALMKQEALVQESSSSDFTMSSNGLLRYKDRIFVPDNDRDIAEFVVRCLTCNQFKAKHQRQVGLLQPLYVPEWKWEDIEMDLVVGLPRTTKNHDSAWTDGQSERTIRILEDMLRCCALDFSDSWN